MDLFEKIELFNSLKDELEKEFGYFDTIEIVNDYNMEKGELNEEGIFQFDTGGCEESVPVCIAVKRRVNDVKRNLRS